MTHHDDDPLKSPDCMKEETTLVNGPCPECGQELEFFSLAELRNQKTCYHCKKPFDAKAFAAKAGLSV
ncbi:MAG: hypothetical protein FWG97_05100 [Deltaproteobacteria bacterium]|nr:hypothetical protein [Deltaproteobacteria bacterium]